MMTNSTLLNCTFNCTDDNEENDEDYEIFGGGFSAEADIFPIILSILIILINAFVLLLVYRRKALRSVTNYILCSLAVSDLLTGLLSIPLFLACNITWGEELCFFAPTMLRITSISTVLHLLMVTIDRYLAIIYSLRYHSFVTKTRAIAALAVIWSISLFMGFIHLAWTGPDQDVVEKPESVKEKEIPFDIISLVLFFVIPLIVMVATYSCIFFEVLRQSKNIKKNSIPGVLENRRQTRHEWKAAVMFAIMLIVFVLCWFSYFIMRLQHNFSDEFFELSHVAEYVLMMLRFLTSLINPCLYIFGKHDFRKALSKVFGWKRVPSRSEMTRSSLLKTTEM